MSHERRFTRPEIADVLRTVTDAVHPHVERIAWVGSWRRGKADLGDADILIVPTNGQGEWTTTPIRAILRAFDRTIYHGGSFLYGYIGPIGVNVFIAKPDRWGSALQYTTGSREHNIAVRAYAKSKGLMANQDGVFHRSPRYFKVKGSSETEAGFYRSLGLRWVRPARRDLVPGSHNPGLFPLSQPSSHPNPATGIAGAQGDGREALVSPEGGSQPADQRTTRRP